MRIMCISFDLEGIYKESFMSLDSKIRNQIDHVLIKKSMGD